jgi:hypothetical protein
MSLEHVNDASSHSAKSSLNKCMRPPPSPIAVADRLETKSMLDKLLFPASHHRFESGAPGLFTRSGMSGLARHVEFCALARGRLRRPEEFRQFSARVTRRVRASIKSRCFKCASSDSAEHRNCGCVWPAPQVPRARAETGGVQAALRNGHAPSSGIDKIKVLEKRFVGFGRASADVSGQHQR